MSALCCAAPSLNGSSLPVYHFNRPTLNYSLMPMELNGSRLQQQQQQPFACYPDQQQFTYQQQQQQQFLMPQHQAASRARRKRLEDALTEAIPTASTGKVSQRIAQLQQSLYASCHSVASSGRIHPSSSSSRPLSLDPTKDYSLPLTVDCSIEYDLPRVARPPPGAKPLLLIARRPSLPAVPVRDSRQQQQQQLLHNWNQTSSHGGYFVMNVAPVSSSSSEDSGRGTDSERAPSPISAHHPSQPNWMNIAEQSSSWIRSSRHHVKPAAIPQHPRPAEAARARVTDQPGCLCCPSRASQVPQRWAPYNTTMARHGCPAPQPENVESWTRCWTNDHLLSSSSSSSSSLMAFHI